MKDYYKILEINKSASQQEIKKAYRRLAVKYHPDKSDYPAASKLFTAINEAYQTLSDPSKRDAYDTDFFFESLKQDPVTEPAPRPKPRTKRPRKRYAPKGRSQREIILPYLKYTRWLSMAFIFFSVIILLDSALPLESYRESVQVQEKIMKRQLLSPSQTCHTQNSMKIYVKTEDFAYLQFYPEIITYRTFIFNKFIVSKSLDGDKRDIVPFLSIHTNFYALPYLLLTLSLAVIFLKIKAETRFTLALVALFLFFFNLGALFF